MVFIPFFKIVEACYWHIQSVMEIWVVLNMEILLFFLHEKLEYLKWEEILVSNSRHCEKTFYFMRCIELKRTKNIFVAISSNLTSSRINMSVMKCFELKKFSMFMKQSPGLPSHWDCFVPRNDGSSCFVCLPAITDFCFYPYRMMIIFSLKFSPLPNTSVIVSI